MNGSLNYNIILQLVLPKNKEMGQNSLCADFIALYQNKDLYQQCKSKSTIVIPKKRSLSCQYQTLQLKILQICFYSLAESIPANPGPPITPSSTSTLPSSQSGTLSLVLYYVQLYLNFPPQGPLPLPVMCPNAQNCPDPDPLRPISTTSRTNRQPEPMFPPRKVSSGKGAWLRLTSFYHIIGRETPRD